MTTDKKPAWKVALEGIVNAINEIKSSNINMIVKGVTTIALVNVTTKAMLVAFASSGLDAGIWLIMGLSIIVTTIMVAVIWLHDIK